MNTFETIDVISNLKNRIDSGELDPEVLADTIESLEANRDEKLNSAANWYEKNDSKIDWATKKIKELQAFKKHYENVNKSLDYYFDSALKASGTQSLMTKDHIIEYGRKSTHVEADIDKIPIRFIKEKVTKSADKTALKDALKDGEDIQGARLVTSRKVRIQ